MIKKVLLFVAAGLLLLFSFGVTFAKVSIGWLGLALLAGALAL